MQISLTLTRPDGTPLADDELPAKGTVIVLQLDEVNSSARFGLAPPAITARVLGWVPAPWVDAAARRLLRAACRSLNIRDEGKASDRHRSAV